MESTNTTQKVNDNKQCYNCLLDSNISIRSIDKYFCSRECRYEYHWYKAFDKMYETKQLTYDYRKQRNSCKYYPDIYSDSDKDYDSN